MQVALRRVQSMLPTATNSRDPAEISGWIRDAAKATTTIFRDTIEAT